MTKRITLAIEGMECPNCAMKLESIEDRLDGILLAEASYRKGLMRVDYDEAVVGEAKIQTEIQRLGYTVSAVWPAE